MFTELEFLVLQARYIKVTMVALPTYQPEEQEPADVQALVDQVAPLRTAWVNADTALGLARGQLKAASAAGHSLCVRIYPILKSRFRDDETSLGSINRLPIQDEAPADTYARMEAMSILWDKLPFPPGSDHAFIAWPDMDQAAFEAAMIPLRDRHKELAGADQTYQLADGNLRKHKRKLDTFITAALIQGRNQFLEGTTERELIDNIPTEPAQQPPDQALLEPPTSPAAGQARLRYSAPRGTSYDVFRKGPGEATFTRVVDDRIEKELLLTGLAPGLHEFQVSARNSRGEGDRSATGSLNIS